MDRRNLLVAVVCLVAMSLSGSMAIAQSQSDQKLNNTGVVTVLVEAASAGSIVLRVTDPKEIDRDARLLIKSTDGSSYEVHYVTRIQGNYVYLNTPLVNSFSAKDLLIQGCECDRAMGLRTDGLVGTLNEEVSVQGTTLKYTPVVPLDPKAKLLIRRTDGTEEEVHAIKTYNGTDTITLAGKLKHAFQPGDMLIQGCHVPVGGGFPWWSKLLIGGGATGTITTFVTVIDDCDEPVQ